MSMGIPFIKCYTIEWYTIVNGIFFNGILPGIQFNSNLNGKNIFNGI